MPERRLLHDTNKISSLLKIAGEDLTPNIKHSSLKKLPPNLIALTIKFSACTFWCFYADTRFFFMTLAILQALKMALTNLLVLDMADGKIILYYSGVHQACIFQII